MALLALTMTLPLMTAQANATDKHLTILFTHDMHDRIYSDAQGQGGWVRLATALEQERNTPTQAVGYSPLQYPTITVDGGDFSMGSLLQTIYSTHAPELRLMGQMGYDVATLGNHEFDYRLSGFTRMLNAAAEAGQDLPELAMANYKPPQGETEAVAAWGRYGVQEYVILEREGLRIAVFGIMGHSSHEYAPMSGMELEDPVTAAKRVVDAIRADGGADFVICLSHSGTEEGKGEDYDLAQKVEGIDLIVSGHTHTSLDVPIQVRDTFIVSCGAYTQSLGRITLVKKEKEAAAAVLEYRLRTVDDSISVHAAVQTAATQFQGAVEESYLANYGLGYDQVLARVTGETFTEEQTGNFIGDSYIAAVQTLEGADYRPVDFAVIPSGVIRDVLVAGEVTTAQAFNILSLGSGADGSPGYPLVSVWLTGADLKNAFEVDASIAAFMPEARLYGSGMSWSYEKNRMLLDKVTHSARLLEGGGVASIFDDQLYRVVADLYSGQMLGAVEGKSLGLLSITPRDESGTPIADLERHILTRTDGTELKAWYALAAHLEAERTLTAPELRKTVGTSWNPIKLLAHPGAPTWVALVAILLLVGLAVLVVTLVRRRGRQGSGYHRYRGR